eukprot:TRINITY_DN3536_c0_g2_i1.p1 TRINITY_DN3536_c0_g2~~TRINITY_DN3536_c0_g2_i1.p1  ORF type:complete len:340 (+),score=55.00 TRINITY_DN3536_c0_g2_i1:64-1083(+)
MSEQNNGTAPPQKDDQGKDYYFDSYSHYGIHEEMLKDKVRTTSYRDAIYHNKHMFKDKIVLDVGCGTGILCMFAASAGAKKVIGVDCSSIIIQAKQIVKENGFEDKITLLSGKMEEITMPEGCEKVDIIVSEWMGYFLLYESMLNTVLWARDNLLVPGGKIFPDKSTMHICGIEDESYKKAKIDFWEDVYGYSFQSVKKLAMIEPLVDVVDSKQVMTDCMRFFSIDLYTVKVEDLSFKRDFRITASRRDKLHALVVYFDIEFPGHDKTTFSTSPHAKTTHWKQTVFYTTKALACTRGDVISGTITAAPNQNNHRDFDISINLNFAGKKPCTLDQDFRLR